MKKFYQTEWHEIYFTSFASPSSELPTQKFYDMFYDRFFIKYKNFNELDEGWVTYKTKVAKHIENIVEQSSSVLSIGSGIGIVEDILTKSNKNIEVVAIEPSQNASKWVRSNPNIRLFDGYFPECLDEELRVDLAYANNIDYVFDKDEYRLFLKSVVDYGISDFLIITTANYTVKTALSSFVKSLLGAMKIIEKLNGGQFWGYLRSKSEHRNALIEAGFNEIKISMLGKDTVLIRAKI